jgi:predicted PurR-regulated permease PerM
MNKDGLTRFTTFLLFFILLFIALHYAKPFLIPFCFSALLAMLLLPLSKRLESWKFKRGFSIIICLILVLSVLVAMISLFSSQIMSFAEDLPGMKVKLLEKMEEFQGFIQEKTKVTPDKQIAFAKGKISGILEEADTYIKDLLVSTGGMIATLALMMIYIFFFMYYREKFQNFILMITPEAEHERSKAVTSEISKVTQKYLSGVLTVMVILAIFNSVGLMIIGVPHAIFFGCLAAFLNIVPYIGVLIGSSLPIIVSLLTRDTGTAGAVLILFIINQFLENNFLTPNIVGSQVRVNPLAAIVSIIIGGMIWGVAGMILFIPLIGILKIIFDDIESLKPFGYLIGDDSEQGDPGIFKRFAESIRKRFRKKAAG